MCRLQIYCKIGYHKVVDIMKHFTYNPIFDSLLSIKTAVDQYL